MIFTTPFFLSLRRNHHASQECKNWILEDGSIHLETRQFVPADWIDNLSLECHHLSTLLSCLTCSWVDLHSLLDILSKGKSRHLLLFHGFSDSYHTSTFSRQIIANSTYTVILAGRTDSGNQESSTSALVDQPNASFLDAPTSQERKGGNRAPFSLPLVDMIRPKVSSVQVVTVNETEERVDELEYRASNMRSRESHGDGGMTPSPSTQKTQLDFESEEGDEEKRGGDYFSRSDRHYF